LESTLDWAVLAAAAILLCLERLTYAVAWARPDRFRAGLERLGGSRARDPVDALRRLFLGFKGIQAAVFAGWCAYFAGGWPWPPTSSVAALVAGAVLLASGQVLNALVFRRLGREGVFYGVRFGRSVPWVEGFPFSTLAHPQYVGAVLSVWGLFLVLRFPHPDWWVLPALETLYYAVGAHLEHDDGSAHAQAAR